VLAPGAIPTVGIGSAPAGVHCGVNFGVGVAVGVRFGFGVGEAPFDGFGVGVRVGFGPGVGVLVAGGPRQIERLIIENGKLDPVCVLPPPPPPQLRSSAAARKAAIGTSTKDLRSQSIEP
jgi:hypothetical protein